MPQPSDNLTRLLQPQNFYMGMTTLQELVIIILLVFVFSAMYSTAQK